MDTESLRVKPATSDHLLSSCSKLQQDFGCSITPESRKQNGQVFTPPPVCRFMAGLFSDFPEEFRLLDPGAGIGSLTAAVCERYLRFRSPRYLEVHLFENDPRFYEPLERTLRQCREALCKAGHSMLFHIHKKDFVMACAGEVGDQQFLFRPNDFPDASLFDGVIMNPPYFKVSKSSSQAQIMDAIIHGQPNIYAFFLAIAASKLRPNGKLVAITPRSFCSGPYFREFRHWFFHRMSLDHVHLFESRKHLFIEANVLQESVITRTHRLGKRSTKVTVTRTYGRDFSDALTEERLPASTIVDDTCGAMAVRIPATKVDSDILKYVEAWASRFSDLGLRISTGPVVIFRATEFLLPNEKGHKSVPLISAHNIKPFRTVWPVTKKKWPIAFTDCPASQKHLVPTRNYVLLKRFSAKEERRRLTAGCLFANEQLHPRLALENHINYVYHTHRELTNDELLGIAALFNSTFFDRYFRSISGNTQVNATDIRNIRFPDFETIRAIGQQVHGLMDDKTSQFESIVFSELGIPMQLRKSIEAICN